MPKLGTLSSFILPLSPAWALSLLGLPVKPAKHRSALEILCLWKPVAEPQQCISARTRSGQVACEGPLQAVLKMGWSNYGQHPWLLLGAEANSCPFAYISLADYLIPPTILPETWQCIFSCITPASASLLDESQHMTGSSGKGWIQGRGPKIAVCASDDLAWKHVLCDGLSHTSNKSNQCS